jgi:hypothetical protein
MNMDNYSHISITEDGSLYFTGQHRPGFLCMLYDALLHLGHNGDVSVYRGRMSTAHGQDRCEISVMLPLSPTEPWGMTVVDVELDEIVEQAAHVALTALCGSRLNDTVAMQITLFPIREQEGPMWRQRQHMTDPKDAHFHAGMVVLTEYAQYMFNLQWNTIKTIIQQCLRMTFLEQHVKGLMHENATLRSGTLSRSGQDCELQVAYRRLSEAEHGWHYARHQLDAAHAMVDEHTHAIIHMEHHIEQQDLDLKERATMIATLKQQVQALQLQVPPAPTTHAAPDEPDVESDVDEEWVVRKTRMCAGLTFCYFEWIC